MKEADFVEMIKGHAEEWADLCAVRLKRNAVPCPEHPGYLTFTFLAGESDLFEDLPGSLVTETGFLVGPWQYADSTPNQALEGFRMQWIMAMISLMELLTKPNRDHNMALAEAAEKAGGG